MNTPNLVSGFKFRALSLWPARLRTSSLSQRSGAALLIALAFIVILSTVVLALFSSTRKDLQSASVYVSGQETLRLAQTAVNVVQGQIRDATIQPRVGWASQPGMVRAFDTSGNVTAYKLYSSDVMVKSGFGQADITAEVNAMGSWNNGAVGKSYNALYCDLNSPAVVKRPDPTDPDNTINTPVFPIADPAVLDTDPSAAVSTGAVEGFTANTTVSGTTIATNDTRRLPMPVKWLYVLKDGQLAAPSGNTGTVTLTPAPSQSNPVVGRIAFWTDDDTCKLNINTASEGSFWDVPKANTWSEMRNAIAMPVQGEFPRYVGHPASTSLSPVLASISSNYVRPPAIINATGSQIANYVGNPDSYYRNFVNYYNLTPRINGSTGSSDKSSKSGAQRTSATGVPGTSEQTNPDVWPASDQSATRKGEPVLPDTDRLYATSDELIFKPDRSFSQDFTASHLSAKDFFITANSRAPETTLFGTPRVSLWPQQTEVALRNIKDRLINFCASVGNVSYSFQRAIGTSGLYVSEQPCDNPTLDIQRAENIKLIDYLRNLGSQTLPGYAGRLSTKWGTIGVDRLIVQIFDTVRARTNNSLVNLGNVTYRYGATTRNPRAALTASSLTDMVDNVNGPREYVTPAKLSNDVMGMGRQITFPEVAIVFMASGITNTYTNVPFSYTFPYNPPETVTVNWSGTETSDGESRVFNPPTVEFESSKGDKHTETLGSTNFPDTAKPQSQTTTKVQALMLFKPYLSATGLPVVVPGMQLEVSGLNNLSINGTPFGVNSCTSRFGSTAMENRHSSISSTMGSFQVLANRPEPSTMNSNQVVGSSQNENSLLKEAVYGGTNIDQHYPFVSAPINSTGNTVSFGGGTVTLRLKSWRNATTYQEIPITFPSATFATPQHIGTSSTNAYQSHPGSTPQYAGGGFANFSWTSYGAVYGLGPSTGTQKAGDPLSIRKRLIGNQNGSDNKALAVRPGDVVLSMQWSPTDPEVRGDFRILALTPNVGSEFPNAYSPVTGYGTANNQYNGVSISTSMLDNALSGRFAFSFFDEPVDQYGNTVQTGWARSSATGISQRSADQALGSTTSMVNGVTYHTGAKPVAPNGLTSATLSNGALGDWASGTGSDKDGPFFPAVDPGNTHQAFGGYFGAKLRSRLYTTEAFEPNRMVPSAGILASLMTTNSTGKLQAWQTLLFNPVPAASSAHPGFATPPDHAFLDNFWMPVIEPYPVSEPLSTAGKVNINFQMMPFTHIERSTAFRGALVPVNLSAISETSASGAENYKKPEYDQPANIQIRHEVERNETSKEFLERFNTGGFYRSASEVSASRIIPSGETRSTIATWWNTRRITSDTLREQPYTALLSRITTKSNTFTVHYRVQAVRQGLRPGRNWAQWDETLDQVAGEYRGSTTIERYLDPNTPNIPDYTTVNLSGNYDPIDKFYRWRIVSEKQFAP